MGWLELGDLAEAKAELAHIQAAQQNSPDVLEVRWLICAQEKRWDEGVQLARSLVQSAPERSSGWLHLACYACQMQQLDLARVWLKRALVIGGKEKIRRMALEDPDLAPLWSEIRGL